MKGLRLGLALLAATPSLLVAQVTNHPLAVVWNRSACTIAIDGAAESVGPQRTTSVALNAAADTSPRVVRSDGREVARASRTAHLEVMVDRGCAVRVYEQTAAALAMASETRIGHLRFLESEQRSSAWLDLGVALIAAGATAGFLGSDQENADVYAALSGGASIALTLSGIRGLRRAAPLREERRMHGAVLRQLRGAP